MYCRRVAVITAICYVATGRQTPSPGRSREGAMVPLSLLSYYLLSVEDQSLSRTRKPCCRKETARCCKCSFRSKFANNIPHKYKTSHASKATLQSSKHAGAKHNLTQNQDSKLRVWSQWKSSEAISNHNVGFNYQGFDFRRHSI